MKRKRRQKSGNNPSRRKQAPAKVARFAPGRASDAVDWVGGAGWQKPENGHLVIETVMALHHDQARCMHRCHRITSQRPRPASNEIRKRTQLITMPVSRATGHAIYAQLDTWRQHPTDAWKRMVGRIGLGAGEAAEAGHLPVSFTQIAPTTRDGHLLQPLTPEQLAVLEDDRVIGRLNAGEPQLDISHLENEPQYAAGLGGETETEDMPSILILLAIGRTTAEAVTRAQAILEATRADANPYLVLKLSRITPIDGQMLQTSMESSLQNAEGKRKRILEVALGRKDHLVEPDGWSEVDEETRTALAVNKPSQVTVDANGMPQIWDQANTRVDPYWATKIQ